MQTSYFAKAHSLPNAISIASTSPDFYNGREYLPLAPSWSILSEYKKNHDIHLYTERYYAEILLPLDPQEVLNDVGKYSVLLCWESSEKFCHRHIVAKWFKDMLKIKVEEI